MVAMGFLVFLSPSCSTLSRFTVQNLVVCFPALLRTRQSSYLRIGSSGVPS